MKVLSQDGAVYQDVSSCCIRQSKVKGKFWIVTKDSKELMNVENFVILGEYNSIEEAKKELLNFVLTEAKGNKPLYFFR